MTLSTSAVAVCCCKAIVLAQFVEQPRVLDGDDGLSGEVLDQFDLLVGEGTNFLTVQGEHADEVVLLQHRYPSKLRTPPTSTAATVADDPRRKRVRGEIG